MLAVNLLVFRRRFINNEFASWAEPNWTDTLFLLTFSIPSLTMLLMLFLNRKSLFDFCLPEPFLILDTGNVNVNERAVLRRRIWLLICFGRWMSQNHSRFLEILTHKLTNCMTRQESRICNFCYINEESQNVKLF